MTTDLVPPKRYRYRGLGRFVVGRDNGSVFDIYRGARTLDAARKARHEVSHWPDAYVYDQATDQRVSTR